MKNFIKKILKRIFPTWLINEIKIIRKKSRFKNKTLESTFSLINERNLWNSNESVSGRGSEVESAKVIIEELNDLINKSCITSILDIPCGDFNWMKEINLSNIDYFGSDIVESLIIENIDKYATDNIHFKIMDITKDIIPKVDVILCRDCLVHFSYKDFYKTIRNIKKSESKYLLTTSFSDLLENRNIITGEWRMINLEKKPFNFPKPIQVINEGYERHNKYQDKSLMLWDLSKLNHYGLKVHRFGLVT